MFMITPGELAKLMVLSNVNLYLRVQPVSLKCRGGKTLKAQLKHTMYTGT